MDVENHKKFIKNSYEEYKKIRYVECPAFANEKVYFNQDGFRHLIRKGKKLREIKDQVKRLNLLKYVSKVISESKKFKDYNKNKPINPSEVHNEANFWSLIKIHDNIKIIVIVRQIKDNNKHFFSVMSG